MRPEAGGNREIVAANKQMQRSAAGVARGNCTLRPPEISIFPGGVVVSARDFFLSRRAVLE
jgi:hypothetical protein